MPGSDALRALRWLSRTSGGLLSGAETTTQRCMTKSFSRSMATESQTTDFLTREAPQAGSRWTQPVQATTYSFPSMEPLRFVEYPRNHLMMPLRKDLLHRAVVYEGDMTRQGTASTKWRDEVHGSNRKLAPQKGTGRARVGNKKSPIRKGGGVAFGPKPRDFATGLPRKIYDQAWRTAVSYRYRRGQLIIVDNDIAIPEDATPHLIQEIFKVNCWGRDFGRSTLITDQLNEDLFTTVRAVGQDAKILDLEDLDVKDLLETGRLVIEKKALDRLLAEHSRDLNQQPAKALY
ncbi:mitochondrial 54S ribosomal protein uL4m [Aspergillus candidus]|uniref:Large ribosomal subunit protein uL4m n=1 Tax=Aspergillus candidus TaxID=41067 RepID=A0A2I2FBS9_ASPCN|nr:50S ribosomal protein L4 [Aspergillus candidus]PLB38079.1 50S ribosomal protein L4 [Aspergillus candidus]